MLQTTLCAQSFIESRTSLGKASAIAVTNKAPLLRPHTAKLSFCHPINAISATQCVTGGASGAQTR